LLVLLFVIEELELLDVVLFCKYADGKAKIFKTKLEDEDRPSGIFPITEIMRLPAVKLSYVYT
jgi:hypothetical protein